MRGWRAEEGEFERVLVELVGFEKRELLGETGEMGESFFSFREYGINVERNTDPVFELTGSTFRRPVEVYTKRGGTAK